MNDAILNNYQRWTERAIADVDVINELKDIAENEGKHNIDIMNIYNNDNLDENVEKVISYIADRWRKV